MDLERLERELKNRLPYGYNWGKKQDDSWDAITNFIYTTYSVAKLLERCRGLDSKIRDYAFNRWFNFWSAMGVEDIFCSHPNVVANKNKYDKLVDFQIITLLLTIKHQFFQKVLEMISIMQCKTREVLYSGSMKIKVKREENT